MFQESTETYNNFFVLQQGTYLIQIKRIKSSASLLDSVKSKNLHQLLYNTASCALLSLRL